MKTFKTPKGTELPILNLKGKDYLQVAYRIVWFREEHPDGQIITERILDSKEQVTYRATISILNKMGSYNILSTGEKTVRIKSTLDYEKCETGSVGRAL